MKNILTLRFELETLFIIIFASAVSMFLIFNNHHKTDFNVSAAVPSFLQVTPLPTPTPSPVPATITPLAPTITPTVQTTAWNSSDGTMIVSMVIQTNSNRTKTYSFFTSVSGNNTKTAIFSKTLDKNSSMSIPFNTFSPDNTYLFLQDSENDGNHFLVFKTNGESFANGQNYLDVTSAFQKHTSNYTLHNVTGWASDTLLIIETTNNDKPSTSFWFDVTSQGFIPLSTQF